MLQDENEDMPVDVVSEPGAARLTPAAQPARVSVARRRGLDWLEARAMFVIAVSAVLLISLIGIPRHLSQDGWLALIAGRTIAAHGIPQHDYFTQMSQGVHWVDQQWLAQLLMYGVQRLGGLQLLTVSYVFVTGLAFAAAIAAARDLEAEDLHVLVATLPGAFFYLVTAVAIRTQGLAYPLFVLTLWLLASEVRSEVRRRRVYLVFPILVVWGNLHGSATLGAGLAGLYGVSVLLRDVRSGGLRRLVDLRPWLFIVLSPLTLIATPYGLGMIHYYRVTLLNPQFGRMVTEWKPVTSVLVLAIPLFVVLVLMAVAIIRAALHSDSERPSPSDRLEGVPQLSWFDVAVLAVLGVGAVMAVRNVTWLGLGLMVLLPVIITRALGGRPAPLRRALLNRRLAAAMVLLTVLVSVAVLARPTSWFTSSYPTRAVPTLRSLIASDPGAKILADVRYADWLIWEDPRLFSGRLAFDTSFELLSKPQLEAIADLAANTRNARSVVDAYPIWMLYPGNRAENRTLLGRSGVRVVSRSHKAVIAVRGRMFSR